ncbi:hypothetical protein OG914_21635 [Streptomyces sp. NBC_00291]|nr:hypothetical protein [Streptomyces sp. NBC_00291]MCX5156585.1 hypothetical protein [Streptomyces sp. NBC_00291]
MSTNSGREGRVEWKRTAAVALPAVIAAGAMGIAMAQGALASRA